MGTGFCVVGSVNMDIVTRAARFPLVGETITGDSLRFMPGGKGANQAVALARLGGEVRLVGAIGDDWLGRQYAEVFCRERIATDGLAVLKGRGTGTASITVSRAGENEIIVVPAANALVTPEYVRSRAADIERSAFVLLQLEIPLESVIEAARIARNAGAYAVLDPAPAPANPLPDELYRLIDAITPNETEAAILSGENTDSEEGIRKAADTLLARGVPLVIVKAGSRGAYYSDGKAFARVETFSVDTVDTVAAGDSFNAGFAFARSIGYGVPRAIRYANAVAAISTTKEGAQGAMPTRAELDAFVSERAIDA
ncbi:MAG TPA: ribokinase [Treponemataceae bacterium]|nr:ribokinase [Treponemataceae bacterium]